MCLKWIASNVMSCEKLSLTTLLVSMSSHDLLFYWIWNIHNIVINSLNEFNQLWLYSMDVFIQQIESIAIGSPTNLPMTIFHSKVKYNTFKKAMTVNLQYLESYCKTAAISYLNLAWIDPKQIANAFKTYCKPIIMVWNIHAVYDWIINHVSIKNRVIIKT